MPVETWIGLRNGGAGFPVLLHAVAPEESFAGWLPGIRVWKKVDLKNQRILCASVDLKAQALQKAQLDSFETIHCGRRFSEQLCGV
jgi:hypothetical protein